MTLSPAPPRATYHAPVHAHAVLTRSGLGEGRRRGLSDGVVRPNRLSKRDMAADPRTLRHSKDGLRGGADTDVKKAPHQTRDSSRLARLDDRTATLYSSFVPGRQASPPLDQTVLLIETVPLGERWRRGPPATATRLLQPFRKCGSERPHNRTPKMGRTRGYVETRRRTAPVGRTWTPRRGSAPQGRPRRDDQGATAALHLDAVAYESLLLACSASGGQPRDRPKANEYAPASAATLPLAPPITAPSSRPRPGQLELGNVHRGCCCLSSATAVLLRQRRPA